MDGKPIEENSSNEPAQKHEAGIMLPSKERLDGLMEGPRKHAKYFNDTITEQYPTDLNDKSANDTPKQTPEEVSAKIDIYKKEWLTRYLADTEKQYQSLAKTSSETSLEGQELLFHKIIECTMWQLHDVLGIPRPKKNNEIALHTAQIQLAINSVLMLSNIDNFDNIEHLDKELNVIDATIVLLGRSIDGGPMNEPQVYIAHPKMGHPGQEALFIKFEPTDNGPFIKSEVALSEVIEPGHVPGSVAIELLNDVSFKKVCLRPEFRGELLHKLRLARLKAQSFSSKPTELS